MADVEDSRDEDQWLYGDSEMLPGSEIKKDPDGNVGETIAPPGEPLPPGEGNVFMSEVIILIY